MRKKKDTVLYTNRDESRRTSFDFKYSKYRKSMKIEERVELESIFAKNNLEMSSTKSFRLIYKKFVSRVAQVDLRYTTMC